MHPFYSGSVWLRPVLSLGPLVVDANHIVAAEDLNVAEGTDCTLAVSVISPPRNLEFVATDAAGTDLVVVCTITGKNQFGKTVSETVTLNNAGSFTDSTDWCYSSITSIDLTTLTNKAASDVLNVGLGDRIGLPFHLNNVDEVLAIVQAPTAATAATAAVAGSATYVDLTYSCIKGLTLTAADTVHVSLALDSTAKSIA